MDYNLKRLKEPFSETELEWRVQRVTNTQKAIVVPYVTNRAIQERLDEVFSPMNWKDEYRPWKQKGQICTISVWDGQKWISKEDGADDTQIEPTKGGLSDAEKRAAVKWGIGRYLYTLKEQWVPIKNKGQNYIKYKDNGTDKTGYWDTPTLKNSGGVQGQQKTTVENDKGKMSEEQCAEIYKLAKERERGDSSFDFKEFLAGLHENGSITTKYSHSKQTEKIVWTVEDYKMIKSQLELPF